MIFGFAIGLWAILGFGSILLHAPTDLAGTWRLEQPPGDATVEPRAMTIEQSGRFLQVTIDKKGCAMRMVTSDVSSAAAVDTVTVQLAGEKLQLVLDGPVGGTEFHLFSSGELNGEWRATLVEPAYVRHRSPAATMNRKVASIQNSPTTRISTATTQP
jgi:hypothetical protein